MYNVRALRQGWAFDKDSPVEHPASPGLVAAVLDDLLPCLELQCYLAPEALPKGWFRSTYYENGVAYLAHQDIGDLILEICCYLDAVLRGKTHARNYGLIARPNTKADDRNHAHMQRIVLCMEAAVLSGLGVPLPEVNVFVRMAYAEQHKQDTQFASYGKWVQKGKVLIGRACPELLQRLGNVPDREPA